MDDAITHVIRGDDHISNTPKQIQILRALGHEPPVYAHVADVLGADGKKLSQAPRRRLGGRVPRRRLPPRGADQLPRADRLGARRRDDDHVPRRARRALHARARRLEPGDVRLREARLDERRLPARAGARRSTPTGSSRFLREQGIDWPEERVRAAAPLVQEKIGRLGEFPAFAGLPLRRRRARPGAASTRASSRAAETALADVEPWTAAAIEAALKELCDELGEKPRTVYRADPRGGHRLARLAGPLRVARAARPRGVARAPTARRRGRRVTRRSTADGVRGAARRATCIERSEEARAVRVGEKETLRAGGDRRALRRPLHAGAARGARAAAEDAAADERARARRRACG